MRSNVDVSCFIEKLLEIHASDWTNGTGGKLANAKNPLQQNYLQLPRTLKKSIILTAFHLPSLHLGHGLEVRPKTFRLIIHYLTMLDRFIIQLYKKKKINLIKGRHFLRSFRAWRVHFCFTQHMQIFHPCKFTCLHIIGNLMEIGCTNDDIHITLRENTIQLTVLLGLNVCYNYCQLHV